MAIKTYDASPYFDDFNTSELEDKNYLRILFKPGVSVQVRELNQMQSMLQSQIDKFGRSVYKEGAILDGTTYFTDNVNHIDVDIDSGAANANMNTNMELIVGETIRIIASGRVNELSAEVYAYENISTSGNQRWRLYLRYNSSAYDASAASPANIGEFDDTGTELNRTIIFDSALVTSLNVQILGAGNAFGTIVQNTGVGYSAEITIDKGVFFSRGTFMYNDTTSRLFIEKDSKDDVITGTAVFRLDDVIKTTAEDDSLFDIALGSPNYKAPGGDRYSVDLVPLLLTDDSTITSISQNNNKCASTTSGSTTINYLSLLAIESSQYIAPAKPEYTQLDDKIALRTFEESGNYTVQPFVVRSREFRNNLAGNDGLYNDTQIQALGITTANPDVASGLNGLAIDSTAGRAQTFGESRYGLSVEPGVAYVNGYRIPLKESINLYAEKARDSEDGVEAFGQARLGSYIELSGIVNLPDYEDVTNTYEFYSVGIISTVDTVSAAASGRTAGTYTIGDSDYSVSPSGGTGARFTVVVDSSGAATVTVTAGGSGYAVDDTITIADAQLGGGGVAALTFDVATLATATGVTSRIRGIEKVGTSYRLYIYDLSSEIPRTALSIQGAASLTGGAGTFIGTLAESNISNPTPIFDTGFNIGAILLPYDTIKGITTGSSDSQVVVRAQKNNISVSSSGTITVTCNQMTGKANSAAAFFSDSLDAYVVTKSDGTPLNVTFIDFSTGTSNDTAVLTLSGGLTSGTVDLIAPIKINLDDNNGLQKGIKSIQARSDDAVVDAVVAPFVEITPTSGTNNETFEKVIDTGVSTNDILDLDNYDIIEIVKVVANDGTVIPSSDYELDNGQRDGLYKVGKIKYTGSASLTGLNVDYTYYNRSTTGDYYGVDSYLAGGVSYADIGQYKGQFLTDVLDFRPDDNDTAHLALDPNAATKIKLDYYKSRYDQLVVNTTGEYKIVQGDSDISPSIPSLPDNAMALYTFYIPAYTRSANDIQSRIVDNRRFTMEDIGRLEKRVQNIEYYTSLSLLEREANGKQIIDGNGERFKNGIIVDSFLTGGVANILDPGYQASIDTTRGILRPKYSLNQKRLKYAQKGGAGLLGGNSQNNELLNASRGDGGGNLLSLPFTHEKLIHQPTASIDISVNPYDLASWNGALELSPSGDEWIEVNRKPALITNIESNADVVAAALNESDSFTNVYDSTETNVLGKIKTKSGKVLWGQGSSAAKTAAGFPNWHPVREVTTTFATETILEGYKQEAVVNTVETSMGDKVLDISFVPFIRSRRVYFKAQMLKPNTKVFAFFDGIDISDYCSKATFKKYGIDNEEVDESTFDKEATAAFGEIGVSRQELISSNEGDLDGFFIVPNNQALQFMTGARVFKLTDSSTNNLANTTTSASVTYVARGLLQTKQEQIISTREIEVVSTGERIKEIVPGVTTKVTQEYYDPLAQSFLIGKIPTGCYATQIDLFFKAKSSNVPLNVHLVTVENGQPTQKVIPFSRVTKKASDTLVYETGDGSTTANPAADDIATSGVAVSDTARLATRFKFESPVYLAPGVEYAIVVMSNSPDYRLWMAETGGDDTITGSKISKNTYSGVSFKSQNASTWTPDQNKDFKMTIWRAKFTNLDGFTYRLDPLGIGGSNPNMVFNNLRFLSQDLSFSNTNIRYLLSLGSNDYLTSRDGRLYFNNLQTVTGGGSGNGLLHVDAEFTSESDYVSPVIDLDRISLVAEDNVIGDLESLTTASLDTPQTDTELLPGHGSALSRYITREVELNNASDQVNVIINATKPNDQSEILVYIRTKTGDEPINTIPFEKLTPSNSIPVSSSKEFGEVEYIYGGDGSVEPFSSFQVKIVFTAESTASAPLVKDFRAIATI